MRVRPCVRVSYPGSTHSQDPCFRILFQCVCNHVHTVENTARPPKDTSMNHTTPRMRIHLRILVTFERCAHFFSESTVWEAS